MNTYLFCYEFTDSNGRGMSGDAIYTLSALTEKNLGRVRSHLASQEHMDPPPVIIFRSVVKLDPSE